MASVTPVKPRLRSIFDAEYDKPSFGLGKHFASRPPKPMKTEEVALATFLKGMPPLR